MIALGLPCPHAFPSPLRSPTAQVGPFANPSELYQYYSLPFCRPKEIEEKWLDFGEVLKGDRAHKTLYVPRVMAKGGSVGRVTAGGELWSAGCAK